MYFDHKAGKFVGDLGAKAPSLGEAPAAPVKPTKKPSRARAAVDKVKKALTR